MVPWPSQMAAAVSSQELSMARMTGAAGMGATDWVLTAGWGRRGQGPSMSMGWTSRHAPSGMPSRVRAPTPERWSLTTVRLWAANMRRTWW